jgi:hypothetical protein
MDPVSTPDAIDAEMQRLAAVGTDILYSECQDSWAVARTKSHQLLDHATADYDGSARYAVFCEGVSTEDGETIDPMSFFRQVLVYSAVDVYSEMTPKGEVFQTVRILSMERINRPTDEGIKPSWLTHDITLFPDGDSLIAIDALLVEDIEEDGLTTTSSYFFSKSGGLGISNNIDERGQMGPTRLYGIITPRTPFNGSVLPPMVIQPFNRNVKYQDSRDRLFASETANRILDDIKDWGVALNS